MKFLLGMQVPPTISEKTASPFIVCGRIIKKVEHKQGVLQILKSTDAAYSTLPSVIHVLICLVAKHRQMRR